MARDMDTGMDTDMDVDIILIKAVVELSVTAHRHEPNIDQGSPGQKDWPNNGGFASICLNK